MPTIIYQTDSIIITDYNSMAQLVRTAVDHPEGLSGKEIILVVNYSQWSMNKEKRSVLNLFTQLIMQSRHLGVNITIIANKPQYLDRRIIRCADTCKPLPDLTKIKGE